MLLYHYTARDRMADIMREGLRLGDVPVREVGAGLNAVWLTSDPSPAGHGLGRAGPMTDAERYEMQRLFGALPPPGYEWANKREVRITTRLLSSDRNLKAWLPWARKRLEPDWLNRLHEGGGGIAKAKTWFLYFGVISPSAFVAVDYLDGKEAA